MAAQRNNRNKQNSGVYIDGNTVRKLQYSQAVPERKSGYEREYDPVRHRTRKVRSNIQMHPSTIRRARTKALQMNIGYVGFLSVAAVVSLLICVSYLRLQSQLNAEQRAVAALESQYSELKLNNDAAYSKAVSSVDLNAIRDIAINELGMVYANKDQIVTYETEDKDYVRQYEEIPME